MKDRLRQLSRPILNIFERNAEDLTPAPYARKLLYALGFLFVFLSLVFPALLPGIIARGFWFPMLVFIGVGLTALLVAALGSDGAVAKIWGTRK